MKRREFILVFCAIAIAGPGAARAQRPAMPVVGYLGSGSPGGSNDSNESVTGFRLGLAEAGYEEGRNVAIDFRWAEGRWQAIW